MRTILENGHVQAGVSFLELLRLMFPLQHVDFNVLVLEQTYVAVELQGATICIE